MAIAFWMLAAMLLVYLSPNAYEIDRHEPRALFPEDQPYNRALEFESRAFPDTAARTRTVLIFESAERFSDDQQTFFHDLSRRLEHEFAPQHGWSVMSPFTRPLLASRLISADGRAAMIVINSDTNYITRRSVAQVEHLEQIVRNGLPNGVRFEITGQGGLGRDLAAAAEQAHQRTTTVTLVALLAVLALVYRAPLAAVVPLIAIGISVVVAIMLLNICVYFGWEISTFEKTITVVLLFGSGTDFALFWIASFRRAGAHTDDRRLAARQATSIAGPAILASAATTICGLLMLLAADLLPSHNAGRALAIALTVSLVASLTLVPALALLFRRALFWPRRSVDVVEEEAKGCWAAIGGVIADHPRVAVLVCLLLLCWPSVHGCNVSYTYDALGVIPADSSAAKGAEIARQHFNAQQISSWVCMVTVPGMRDKPGRVLDCSCEVAQFLARQPGVQDVWSLAYPMGMKADSPMAMLANTGLGRGHAEAFYFSKEYDALRFEIMMDTEPFSLEAMASCSSCLDRIANETSAILPGGADVFATGMTPYILNVRDVAAGDQQRVIVLVILVILVIVVSLVKDILMACVMLFATMLVYAVSLGVTEWFFVCFMGQDGIDWKVRLFSFVILVAVGQDYNIFLVSRLLQYRSDYDPHTAVQKAVSQTGSVISSCGIIMAITLGSLAASGLPFLQQLGMAFGVGILVDTFLIRPVFVPAAYLLLRGHGQSDVPRENIQAG